MGSAGAYLHRANLTAADGNRRCLLDTLLAGALAPAKAPDREPPSAASPSSLRVMAKAMPSPIFKKVRQRDGKVQTASPRKLIASVHRLS